MSACASCGCTDEQACPGGCVWATPTLCSRCVLEGPRIIGPDELDAGPTHHDNLAAAIERGGFDGYVYPTLDLHELGTDELDALERSDLDSVRDDWRNW